MDAEGSDSEESSMPSVTTPRPSRSSSTRTASPSPAEEFNFESLDNSSWRSYGSTSAGRVAVNSEPPRALIFPAAVGTAWNNSFTRTENGEVTEIAEANRVVGHNSLTVPAGTFDAYLLETRVIATEGGTSTMTLDYLWLVPGLGRAAEVISLPNDNSESLEQAYAFYRLRSY